VQKKALFLTLGAATQLCGIVARADETASPSTDLQEIVITAQKRTERLSDVPVAASVVSDSRLEARNAGDITDLNNLVPSVDLVGTFNGRVPLGIRGISSNANEATVGLASGVAIMLDGVPIPSDSQSGNQLEDIKSVEVLKGPQATLGGRTASAGVINIVTRGPTDELTADFSSTGTSDGEVRGNGFLAGPITTDLSGSLSLYGNVRKFPIVNEADDEKSVQHNDGARAKLMFKPNEDLDITLMGDYHISYSDGDNFTYRYVTPGAYLLFGTTPPPLPPPVVSTLSQSAVLGGVTPSPNNRFVDSVVLNPYSDIRDQNATLTVNYRLGDLTLGSTTAFQHETQDNLQDIFVNSSYFSNDFSAAFAKYIGPIPGSPASWSPFNNTQTQLIDVKQTSQEFKLVSPTDRPLSYVAGFFFSDQRVDLYTFRTFTPALTDYNVGTDTKTYDIYGRANWQLAPGLSLIGGLRYNFDQLSYDYSQGGGSTVASANSDHSNALVGDLTLQYKFDPRVMAYVSYSRGYAPKVFNSGIYSAGNAAAPTAPLSPTGQTHINDYEIGTKGTFLDGRLTLDADFFYTIYVDYQVQQSAAVPGISAPVEELDSAGKAETHGVEIDAAYAPTNLLRINYDIAYIDARFVDYDNAPCWGNGVIQTAALGCHPDAAAPGSFIQNVSGDTMPDSPRFKGTLEALQRVPLTPGYEMQLMGSYTYRTRAQFQPDQNPEAIQGSFGLLDLSVGVATSSGKYSLTAFCNNVTNHFYVVDIEDFWSPPWNSNAVVQQPARDALRYFGLRFNAKL
jgi:iron complex outermembrane recepter protein